MIEVEKILTEKLKIFYAFICQNFVAIHNMSFLKVVASVTTPIVTTTAITIMVPMVTRHADVSSTMTLRMTMMSLIATRLFRRLPMKCECSAIIIRARLNGRSNAQSNDYCRLVTPG